MYKQQTLIVSLNFKKIINLFFKSDWLITMLFQGQQEHIVLGKTVNSHSNQIPSRYAQNRIWADSLKAKEGNILAVYCIFPLDLVRNNKSLFLQRRSLCFLQKHLTF